MNIIPHQHQVTQSDRISAYGFVPKLIWFTGLSGSGKSTLASALESYLFKEGVPTYILDGDNVRSGLNSDLDFTEAGRRENIRRIAEVSRLFLDAGVVVLTAFISPFSEDRKQASDLVGAEHFLEIHVDCPLEVCEQRDVKGLYKKARAGEIPHFTGIDSPFEVPEKPFLRVNTAVQSLEACLKTLIERIEPRLKHS